MPEETVRTVSADGVCFYAAKYPGRKRMALVMGDTETKGEYPVAYFRDEADAEKFNKWVENYARLIEGAKRRLGIPT